MDTDRDIVLEAFGYRLRVSPYGASLRGLWKISGTTDAALITGYEGASAKLGGQGDLLIPFPGRIKNGQFQFDGADYQLERNDKDGPNAIHGYMRTMIWEITSQTECAIALSAILPQGSHSGYPWSLEAAVTYTLGEQGFRCSLAVTNRSETAAPVAAGFHPYFTPGCPEGFIDSWELRLPYLHYLEFENLIPTGKALPVEDSEFDFGEPHTIGDTRFNTCFLNPLRDDDGLVRIKLRDPASNSGIEVWADGALDYIVVYSGDPLPPSHRRRSLAIEPMTCSADGFNHPEWGLIRLEPGKTTTSAWGVTAK